MPSIQDVADQINARLDQIATNTASTAQSAADHLAVATDMRAELLEANGRLAQVDATLASGLANISQGLFAQLQVQLAMLNLLDHHRQQHDTIICELVNANTLLCEVMRKLGHQVRVSEASLESVQRVEGVAERVHSLEAADYDRDLELRRQLEECCPPEPVPEEPCPERCEQPRHRPRDPSGQDWKPLPSPERPRPVG